MPNIELGLTLLFAFLAGSTIFLLGQAPAPANLFSAWRTPDLTRRTANVLFLVLLASFCGIFGTMAVLRHESFHSGGYDLGIFDQVIWNSLRGRLYENSIMMDSPSFLGHHFSPFLLSLVPLYAVWTDPRMLLLTQTLALGIAALPCYWLARERLGNGIALLVSGAYYLFPAVHFVNLAEFHEIALATPMLSFALYFLLRQRYVPFLALTLLVLLVKEETAFIVIALGSFVLLVQHKWKLGLLVIVTGTLWGIATLLFIIPNSAGPSSSSAYFFVERYGYLGTSIPEIISTSIAHPDLVLSHMLVGSKMEFLLQLLVPLALIPFVGLEIVALSFPTIGYLLLSDDPFQTSIRFQYSAPLIPFMFFALVVGIQRLRARSSRLALPIAVLLMASSLVSYALQSPGPLSRRFTRTQYDLTDRTAIAREMVRQVAPTAQVMAESNFVSHLSERRFVYQAPHALDLRRIDYLLADNQFPTYPEYRDIWDDVLHSAYFQTILEHDGLLFKKREVPRIDHPLQVPLGGRISLVGYSIESSIPIKGDGYLSVLLLWHADRDVHERYIVFVHLVDSQGKISSQGDREPANGWLRTDHWQAGDLVPDRYQLELGDVAPGTYHLNVGLYDVMTQDRLMTDTWQDHVQLGPIEID